MQYLPWLARAGFDTTTHPLISDPLLIERYKYGRYGLRALVFAYAKRLQAMYHCQLFDLVWIEKEALPWWPVWIELAFLRGVPYVLDYDDAIFHNYDQHKNPWLRRIFSRRLDRLMGGAALVVAGNDYLAARARQAGAAWVEVMPTVIDLMRYPYRSLAMATNAPALGAGHTPRIVWIGSPSTVHYLQLLREPLAQLAMIQPFVLRIIGGGALDLPGVPVEVLPWAEASEVADISACDVGIMPLRDSLWERGKCGYKLIQYMACGLPVVASSVGVNPEIVCDGESGYLAMTSEDWVTALSKLLRSPALRAQMGAAGRSRVEAKYCIQKTGPAMAQLLRTAAEGRVG